MFTLESTAPYVRHASTLNEGLVDWGDQPNCREGTSKSSGRLLHKDTETPVEVGLWRCTPGRWPLEIPHDELCHFTSGRAVYTRDNGEVIEIKPNTVVHFKAGWKGEAEVSETIFVSYMLCPGGPSEEATPVLADSHHDPAKADWGVIPTMLEGESKISGILLARQPDRKAESGIWICTPGKWFCHVTSDEFCHFLTGRATYVHENGEVIEIEPDTASFFPQDWKGTCTVHETVRKVYMIRQS